MERLKNSKGFTILELMTILVLLGFVIAGGFRLYFFADLSFMAGCSMADLHAELHWAMQKITDEVRLAHSLRVGESKKELLAHLPNGGAELSLFFIYPEKGSIYLETPNGQRQLLDGTSAGTAYKVSFDPVTLEQPGGEPLTNLLRITLTSEGLERDFGLESELQVLNLRTEGIQGDQGEAIMFTKTFTPEEFDAAEKLLPGCVFGCYVYDPQAPELNALRQFRDNTLAVTPWGRFLVKAYYSVSPVLISFVERYAWAKAPVVKIFETAAQLVLRFS